MNIRKIGMRPMSRMSSSTHGADIRKFSTRDVFTHVKKRLVIPKVDQQQHCWIVWMATISCLQHFKMTNFQHFYIYCMSMHAIVILITYLRWQVKEPILLLTVDSCDQMICPHFNIE